MTNREAYMSDLDDLRKAIDCLLSMVPVGKTKYEKQMREQEVWLHYGLPAWAPDRQRQLRGGDVCEPL